jgi:zinc/manganese transport system permease protein
VNLILRAVFEPGFFTSAPVRVALLAGGLAALVSGVVGTFAVMRGQSYAGTRSPTSASPAALPPTSPVSPRCGASPA